MNKSISTDESRKLAFGVEPSTRRYRLRLARYKAMAEEVASFVREQKPKEGEKLNLLDVGLGSGRSMRYIGSEGVSEHISFFGIDKSMERLASVYNSKRWVLKQHDLEQGELPFVTGMFDIVICEQVLEHLANPSAVMQEIVRILRPKGLLIVGTTIYLPGLAFVRRHIVSLLDRLVGMSRSHLQFFSYESFAKFIEQANCFTVRKVRGFRIISGGPFAWLENFYWWYKFNRFLGKMVPSLCPDIQIIAIRDTRTGPP